ncbi:MAG TPA: acyl-CoA synthetase [Burkholderiaceae bacterium]|nr:acyl-CoA synthetase [Burkholderiaceae bacterium]
MPSSIFDHGLDRNPANFAPLSPLGFLERAGTVFPTLPAIVHGSGAHAIRRTWGETYQRCRRLASALARRGLGRGDTVAALLANTPELVEAHFGVPMAGCVLAAMNTRLDAGSIGFMLEHGEARVLLVDREYASIARAALHGRSQGIEVIDVDDPVYDGPGERFGSTDYERLLAEGDPQFAWAPPGDEWDAIALNYTSGTTGNPKGVVYHHRGAYLNAVSNILVWAMPQHPVYLWTLPMFHCNGWCFPWTVAAMAGVNVCLRRVEAKAVLDAIRAHRVTHYCGAPIVHAMLVNAAPELKAGIGHRVAAMVAGAAPPAAMIEGMYELGFDLTHVYGLTEVYGPATVCPQQPDWAAKPIGEVAALNSRQGVRYPLEEAVAVLDPATMQPVPADAQTIGEVMFRGNIAMKGYLKNETATREAFAGGWFHSGDLAVLHPDGYLKIKDRSKDIIISGGENISSIEVEDVLYRHPAVMAAAVVAQPDPKWGEVPCAFIELKDGQSATAEDILAHCRAHLARFKVPKGVVFGSIPKTSTGKIQKFELRQRARSTSAIDV